MTNKPWQLDARITSTALLDLGGIMSKGHNCTICIIRTGRWDIERLTMGGVGAAATPF
jgi:hypothetical protein